MREDGNAPRAEEATRQRECERAPELVAYLYGEATHAEAEEFRRHLDACAVCRQELAAFGSVREGLGEWRAEVLGSVPALGIEEAIAPAKAHAHARRRSAAAALREFFSLSPLWLRWGAAAAALAVCLLAALTLARAEVRWDSNGFALRAGVTERVVTAPVHAPVQAQAPAGYTREQVEAIVAERLGEAEARWQAERAGREIVSASAEQQPQKRSVVRASAVPGAQRTRRGARRGKDADEEMADLPRLSDLLNGSY